MSGHISLVTQQHSPKLANPVNTVAATALVTRYASATPSGSGTVKPISVLTTSNATGTVGGTLVVPGGMNYLKIMPFTTSGAATPLLRVVGWSYSKDTNLWIPYLICQMALTTANSSGGITVNANALISYATLTIGSGIGDAKIFNATSMSTNAFFVVDTLGFEQIELCFQVSSGSTNCNAFVSEM